MSAAAPIEPGDLEAPQPTDTACAASTAIREPLRSDELLQGRRVVEIAHNGEIYRLQATRLGKLILTK